MWQACSFFEIVLTLSISSFFCGEGYLPRPEDACEPTYPIKRESGPSGGNLQGEGELVEIDTTLYMSIGPLFLTQKALVKHNVLMHQRPPLLLYPTENVWSVKSLMHLCILNGFCHPAWAHDRQQQYMSSTLLNFISLVSTLAFVSLVWIKHKNLNFCFLILNFFCLCNFNIPLCPLHTNGTFTILW